jgi:hypothetical protein
MVIMASPRGPDFERQSSFALFRPNVDCVFERGNKHFLTGFEGDPPRPESGAQREVTQMCHAFETSSLRQSDVRIARFTGRVDAKGIERGLLASAQRNGARSRTAQSIRRKNDY